LPRRRTVHHRRRAGGFSRYRRGEADALPRGRRRLRIHRCDDEWKKKRDALTKFELHARATERGGGGGGGEAGEGGGAASCSVSDASELTHACGNALDGFVRKGRRRLQVRRRLESRRAAAAQPFEPLSHEIERLEVPSCPLVLSSSESTPVCACAGAAHSSTTIAEPPSAVCADRAPGMSSIGESWEESDRRPPQTPLACRNEGFESCDATIATARRPRVTAYLITRPYTPSRHAFLHPIGESRSGERW
jgi:hypothetical protein